MRVLTVNPGATSTKIGVFDDENVVLKQVIEHHGDDLKQFKNIFDQYKYRVDLITGILKNSGISLDVLDAIVGRGGLLKPVLSGTYIVNDVMVQDLKKAERGEHASNLGAVIAYNLAKTLNIPAYIVDPVAVDEMEDEARISGMPELPRISLSHALNSKAVARKACGQLNKQYGEVNLIIAHLGTGISVSCHRNGRMVDVNAAQDEGPFSPDRCGGVPSWSLVKLCYSGKYTEKEMLNKLMSTGGIYAYLGIKDIREVQKRASEGDKLAQIVLKAMIYQVAKEIGAMSTVLFGKVDRIVLTGGIAWSKYITDSIIDKVKFIAPVIVIPGEEELESLAAGALRVLRGEETPHIYK